MRGRAISHSRCPSSSSCRADARGRWSPSQVSLRWLTGLVVGGGAFLAMLLVPAAYITRTRLLSVLFLLGVLQGTSSRPAWWRAVPLGTLGAAGGYVGPDAATPLASALRILAHVVVVNTPGLLAALLGLSVRIVAERVVARTGNRG